MCVCVCSLSPAQHIHISIITASGKTVYRPQTLHTHVTFVRAMCTVRQIVRDLNTRSSAIPYGKAIDSSVSFHKTRRRLRERSVSVLAGPDCTEELPKYGQNEFVGETTRHVNGMRSEKRTQKLGTQIGKDGT